MKALADQINRDCAQGRYFWAAGLIRESLFVWQGNESLLCEDAIAMLNTYRNAEAQ